MSSRQLPTAAHATATVRGGRLRLPAAVLREFNLKDGGEVVFFIREGRALIAPLGERVLQEPAWD